jgi:hypothetical protein
MECLECGAQAAGSGQSCARCGAPLPQSKAALPPRSVTGARPVRVRRMPQSGAPIAPGFYRDPGGAGIREWTGTEWSPFLQGYPAGHGPGVGADPAPTWSPLPPDVQQAQWDRALALHADALAVIVIFLACALMMAFCTVLVAFADPDPQAPAVIGMCALLTVGCLVPVGVAIRNRPARRRIAEAAREALALASAQDTPTPPEAT